MDEPPEIDATTRNRYHGYFENELGEQAVFVCNDDTKVVDRDAPELGMNENLRLKVCVAEMKTSGLRHLIGDDL